ncbi:hypothetical protein AB4Y32_24045 [Paraburkholderia phymatum]|uniref:Uncharacterized protein n=1 Tax=Paraburkholderia phymatum TaxID=148447 RepID=A0ACC6U5I4_9BURK
MPTTKFDHKWSVGEVLTPPSQPGCYVRVLAVNFVDDRVGYVAEVVGEYRTLNVPAEDMERYYRKPTDEEWDEVDGIENPPPPADPDFDEDGFPNFRPDHI